MEESANPLTLNQHSVSSNVRRLQNDIALTRFKNNSYTFRKKKPSPGSYPLHYSPYRLSNSHVSRAISIPRQDALSDLESIRRSISHTFISHYFEEPGAPVHRSPASAPACIQAPLPSSSLPKPPMQRNAARTRPRPIQTAEAPQTPEEERRQLRAAIRASKALLARAAHPEPDRPGPPHLAAAAAASGAQIPCA